MTPHEKLALAIAGLVLALFVLGTVTHYLVLARWWWPVVGSAWRAERHRVRLAQRAWDDVWQDDGDRYRRCWQPDAHNRTLHGANIDCPVPSHWSTEDFPGPDSTTALRAGDANWDELDPDSQADQLIAEWHDEPAPTEPWVYIPDRNTWRWQDDPDLIVWDARQQAARCWEIVHVEFPRLRRELMAA